MKKNVTIRGDQTLLDLALQYFGGAENVYDLIEQNPDIESIMDTNYPGLALNYELNTGSVAEFFRKNGVNVATRYPAYEVVVDYRTTDTGDFRVTTSGDSRII